MESSRGSEIRGVRDFTENPAETKRIHLFAAENFLTTHLSVYIYRRLVVYTTGVRSGFIKARSAKRCAALLPDSADPPKEDSLWRAQGWAVRCFRAGYCRQTPREPDDRAAGA